MAELGPFPPGAYPVVVLGTGAGGLQLSYSLTRLGVEHALLSADHRPAGMFQRFPFFQRLISWTKPYALAGRGSRAYERYDWNTLLVEEDGHRAGVWEHMDGTSYFPSRPEMEAALVAFDTGDAKASAGDAPGELVWLARVFEPSLVEEEHGPALLGLEDESVGDGTEVKLASLGRRSTAEVVAPLWGTLQQGTASVMDAPTAMVPGVYETVAPSTSEVDALARLVTDGLHYGDETTPGSVLAAAAGQHGFTAALVDLLTQTWVMPVGDDSGDVAATLHEAPIGRPAAALDCPASVHEAATDDSSSQAVQEVPSTDAKPWDYRGAALPDLKIIPGGATGSTAGVSVDSGHNAVCVSPSAAGEEVSLSRTVIGELGRPLDRAAELSVAPD